jgi:UDP-glucose 4-epimerase
VLDDLSTGAKANLAAIGLDRRLHYVRGTITNIKTLSAVVKKVDAVVHLAAAISPFISIETPEVTHRVNVTGTLNVLNACRANGVRQVVFASSSSVYGNTGKLSHIGELQPTNPLTPYGASKLAGEKYCQAFSATYGIGTVSLRYFNVYGERQRNNPYSGVIAIFANKLIKQEAPTIYGSGKQTRDFVHVQDVARANLKALEFRGKSHAFNIGTGVSTSINQLYSMLAESLGIQSVIPIRENKRPGDILHSCADASASSALGFRARVGLREGLNRLIEWLKPT